MIGHNHRMIHPTIVRNPGLIEKPALVARATSHSQQKHVQRYGTSKRKSQKLNSMACTLPQQFVGEEVARKGPQGSANLQQPRLRDQSFKLLLLTLAQDILSKAHAAWDPGNKELLREETLKYMPRERNTWARQTLDADCMAINPI